VFAEAGESDDLVYLTIEDALEIYAAIIDSTAAQAADHLRSREALEGALGRPASYAHYELADVALQASVLAHGIAETQPFSTETSGLRWSPCSRSWRSTGFESARPTRS
jgi:hypothetical protein